MEESTAGIGRRLREIRAWRRLSLRAVAELAGLSAGYLSRIERGERPVDKRSTLEALAAALHVAPSELTSQPFPPETPDPIVGEAQATVSGVEAALTDLNLGDVTVAPRPYPAVAEDLRTLNERLRPATDYAAQGMLLPGLLAELHALYATDPKHRREVLVGLMNCYHTAAMLTKNLGVRGLPALASWHARRIAEELDDAAWLGVSTWMRALTLGGPSRGRMLELSTEGARELEPRIGKGDRELEVYGMLRLNAALASAAMRRPDDAQGHLSDAADLAQRRGRPANPAEVRGFASLYFGPDNVGIWQVSTAVELGEPGKAQEVARDVHPEAVPSAARQAMFWADLGRGMASEKATRDDAVDALRRAEDIAPQRIRTNPFVRETVTDLVRRARRDAVGRELRGMAYRMGLSA